MKILYVAWTDLGRGNEHRARAINECTDSEAKCWAVNEKYHSDLPRTKEGLKEGVEWADVIHQRDTYPWIFGLDVLPNFVCEFSGGFLRMYSLQIWNWQIKRKRPIITTPELGRYVPRFHYIPTPIDVSSFEVAEGWPETTPPLRVVQTPSRRDYKDTDLLIEVCEKMENVELELVEGRSYEEAIEAKRKADVYFDQIKVGDFGRSALEAMSLGLVVIGRLMPVVRAYNPGCPIVDVRNAGELREALEALIEDTSKCELLKLESRSWVEDVFSYEAVAPRMLAFYEYVLNDDPEKDLWNSFTRIYRETAQKEHGINTFIDPEKLRW